MKKWIVILIIFCAISLAFIPSKSRSYIKSLYSNTLSSLVGEEENLINQNTKKLGDYEFKMIFESAEKRMQIANNGILPNKTQVDEGEKLLCYEIRISHESQPDILKISNEYSFEKRVVYFASEMQKDISLIVGSDTLPCILYHFERNYGVAPYLSLHTGFLSPKNWKTLPHHLWIRDEYFHFGDIHLENLYNASN